MKNFSKICINSSIFISSNIMTLLTLKQHVNAMPNPLFSKPSTLQLLSEAIKNPTESFIQRLSNWNLRASFLHSGRTGHSFRNFNIRSGAYIGVKKTSNSDYSPLISTKFKKRLTADGINFKIHTLVKIV